MIASSLWHSWSRLAPTGSWHTQFLESGEFWVTSTESTDPTSSLCQQLAGPAVMPWEHRWAMHYNTNQSWWIFSPCEFQTPATLAVPKGHQDLDITAATELPSPEIIGAFSLFQIDKLDMKLFFQVNLLPWAWLLVASTSIPILICHPSLWQSAAHGLPAMAQGLQLALQPESPAGGGVNGQQILNRSATDALSNTLFL